MGGEGRVGGERGEVERGEGRVERGEWRVVRGGRGLKEREGERDGYTSWCA